MPPSSRRAAAGVVGDRLGDAGEAPSSRRSRRPARCRRGRSRRRTRRAGSTSAPPPGSAAGGGAPARRAGRAAARAPRAPTNMVSRSLAAGNIIMPPTANIISGKTSVCSRPRVEACRSASVPGSAAAWPANADTPPSSCALGEQQHADHGEQQDQAPAGRRPGRRRRSRPRRRSSRAPRRRRDLGRGRGRRARRRRTRRRRPARASTVCDDVAPGAGHERLDEYADARDAEDEQQRRELGVLDARAWRTRSLVVLLSRGAGGHRRRGVGHADAGHAWSRRPG